MVIYKKIIVGSYAIGTIIGIVRGICILKKCKKQEYELEACKKLTKDFNLRLIGKPFSLQDYLEGIIDEPC